MARLLAFSLNKAFGLNLFVFKNVLQTELSFLIDHILVEFEWNFLWATFLRLHARGVGTADVGQRLEVEGLRLVYLGLPTYIFFAFFAF